MAMQSLVSVGNKSDGVACAMAQKVVNVNVTWEEEKPGLSPWWMTGILLMGFVPHE